MDLAQTHIWYFSYTPTKHSVYDAIASDSVSSKEFDSRVRVTDPSGQFRVDTNEPEQVLAGTL